MSRLSFLPTDRSARSSSEAPPFFLLTRTFLDHQAPSPPATPLPTPRETPAALETLSPQPVSPEGAGIFRNVRFRRLGQHVEAYYSPLGWYVGRAGSSPGPARSSPVPTPEERAAHRRRADQRARSQVRRLVLGYDLQHLWTLTFAAPVPGLDPAWQAFTAFTRRARRRWGGFHYVAVASVHPGRSAAAGAPVWHFHVAVSERRSGDELADLWTHGRVWARPFLDNQRRPHPLGLAHYLNKNLSEAAAERGRGRRYRAAQGMRIETVDGAIADADELSQRLGALDGRVVSLRHMEEWEGITALIQCPVPSPASPDPFTTLCQGLTAPPPPPSSPVSPSPPVPTAPAISKKAGSERRAARTLSASPPSLPSLAGGAIAGSPWVHVYPRSSDHFTDERTHFSSSPSAPVSCLANRAPVPSLKPSCRPLLARRPLTFLPAPLPPTALSPPWRAGARAGKSWPDGGRPSPHRCSPIRPRGP